jgi:hypothetical protein
LTAIRTSGLHEDRYLDLEILDVAAHHFAAAVSLGQTAEQRKPRHLARE